MNTEPEAICPNLLQIKFPAHLYHANLNIDEKEILENLNSYLISIDKKPIKKMRREKLVSKALKRVGVTSSDWILHGSRIYTFINLHKSTEPLALLKKFPRGIFTKVAKMNYGYSSICYETP
jgi:hypothetical protein